MQRDVAGGVVLIAGALAGVFALALHPTGHDMLAGPDAAGQARLSLIVHSVALAGVPAVLLGLVALARRLAWTELAVAALVVHGFAAVAVMVAGVASGFIATPLLAGLAAEGGGPDTPAHLLAGYSAMLNRAFARIYVVAASSSLLLWAAAIARHGRFPRGPSIGAGIIGSLTLIAVLSGHVGMDVHGFGMITFAHASWLIWIGILLLRRAPTEGAPG